MYIAARERKILEILLAKQEGTTVKHLAEEIDVSSRTVHRDLKGVEDILTEYNLSLIKKSGSGIQVAGDDEMKDKLQLFLFNLSHNEYTPEERQTFILSSLLDSSDPVKLLSLANDLNVTIATISNDLDKVSDRIEPFGLSLIRKRGYGVEIEGSETAKRRAMSSLIQESLNEFEFLSLIKENIQKKSTLNMDAITDRLLGLVDKKKLLIVEKQVDEVKNQLPYSIADSAYIGLVVHLALAVERVLQGENINFDPNYLETMKDTKEFTIAQKIIENLEKVFQIKFPYGETGYITMHLMGAKLRNDQDYFLEDSSFQVGVKAQKLISFVGKQMKLDLVNNLSLFQGLVAHLRPAIYRIKQNMGISNPLLKKIETDYFELFAVIEEGVTKVFPDINMPKEEIGYLVMHFASAILKKAEAVDFSALVICSSGIGTSKILATKLQQEIPEIKKIRNVSFFDLAKLNQQEYQVIISTIPLKDFTGDYILVSPILSEEEITKIRSYLKTIKTPESKKKITEYLKPKKVRDGSVFVDHLKKLQRYSATISTILEGFTVQRVDPDASIEKALRDICRLLADRNVVTDYESVVADLLKRQNMGGLGIPNTVLALYHTRSAFVSKPSFTIYELTGPLQIKAMDASQIEVRTILLMLSPEEVSDETLEILSHISSMIIRDEETIQRFESNHETEIFSLLAGSLETFFEKKLNERRRD